MKAKLIGEIKEIKQEQHKLSLYVDIINAVLVFLVSALILRFIISNIWFAAVPTVAYLIYAYYISGRINENALVQKISLKNPDLSEKIKTAYDNRKQMGKNVVLRSLNREVSKLLEKTGVSSLIDSNRLAYKTMLAVFLSFILLSINFIGFDMNLMNSLLDNEQINKLLDSIRDTTGFDLREGLSGTGEKKDFTADDRYEDDLERQDIGSQHGGVIPGFDEGNIPDAGGGAGTASDEDIFGDPTTASIEGRNVDMKLNPEYGGNIELREVNEQAEGWEIPERDLSGEASGMPQQEPVKYKEFIKRYFEAMQEEVQGR
ncbi:MAG: hypothetical protein B6U97_00890 [Candidatus Altiarchaeales archaeon ex4484_96]|nr:MAG: hypothetical protein B6U97_00890 [Candidatus Altiarchaeales archaeon ex4484_96]